MGIKFTNKNRSMKTRGKLIAGTLAIASAGVLLSFTLGKEDSKKDDGKMKSYQILHHEDGKMIEFDTLLPNNSTYTVEQFLADKGIDNENVKIINLPSSADHMMIKEIHHGDDGMHRSMENVMITVEMDDDGNMTSKKMVNGKEVELTAEELEEMKEHHRHGGEHHRGGHEMIVIKDGKHSEGDHEMIQIQVEIDDDGNQTIKKTVNGEEVEMTEEELDKMEMHKGDHHGVFIKKMGDDTDVEISEEVQIMVEIDDDGNKTIKKIVNGEEVEISDEDLIEIESHEHGDGVMEMIIEIEDGELGEVEKAMMIIEEMDFTSGEHGEHEVIVIDGHSENSWHSENHGDMEFIHCEEGENFTLVLVTEDIDAKTAKEKSIEFESKRAASSVYPNPNDGVFTIDFDQPKKAKTKIEITDVQGRVVFEDDLGKYSGRYIKEVNLKEFGAGIYMVAIQQGNDRSVKKVIVK